MIKKQLHILGTALMFFTRLPLPGKVPHSDLYFQKCSRYFPLVGILVGGIGGGIFYLAIFLFPVPIAILMSVVATILTTGAFHEDGFADACDGFGGGWRKEQILAIMKDSRLGTFGVIGLILILAGKFLCLQTIPISFVPLSLITAHAVSRFSASILLYLLPYVRPESESKTKPGVNQMSVKSLVIGLLTTVVPIVFFKNCFFFLVLLPPVIASILLSFYFRKWIGGQTGDCGGAAQQLCEVICYLTLIILWKFI